MGEPTCVRKSQKGREGPGSVLRDACRARCPQQLAVGGVAWGVGRAQGWGEQAVGPRRAAVWVALLPAPLAAAQVLPMLLAVPARATLPSPVPRTHCWLLLLLRCCCPLRAQGAGLRAASAPRGCCCGRGCCCPARRLAHPEAGGRGCRAARSVGVACCSSPSIQLNSGGSGRPKGWVGGGRVSGWMAGGRVGGCRARRRDVPAQRAPPPASLVNPPLRPPAHAHRWAGGRRGHAAHQRRGEPCPRARWRAAWASTPASGRSGGEVGGR